MTDQFLTPALRETALRAMFAANNGGLEWGSSAVEILEERYGKSLDAVAGPIASAAVSNAADTIDFEWETFRAADGFRSIRMHGKSPETLLHERAETLGRSAGCSPLTESPSDEVH